MEIMTQQRADAAFKYGIQGIQVLNDRFLDARFRRWADNPRHMANRYDDTTATFHGGEMELLTQRNYEKALAHIWKAELIAPYLNIHDASKADYVARKGGAVTAAASGFDPVVLTEEIKESVGIATSEEVRREFQEAHSPEQREALMRLVSFITHGEAYALFTSATLMPVVQGTGAKLGMAMQVMEEAKHFFTLREMCKSLDRIYPMSGAGKALLETIARKDYYHKLFGMNVVLEGFATSIFGFLENQPGLRHIMRGFHMDESRHSAFPQTYAKLGNIPHHVTHSARYKWARAMMFVPIAPLILEFKPLFETLGYDTFAFFGKTLSKVSRLAENSGFKLPFERTEFLMGANILFNRWVRVLEPEKYEGFRDYTLLGLGELSEDMEMRERDVFGNDIFGGVGSIINRWLAKQDRRTVWGGPIAIAKG